MTLNKIVPTNSSKAFQEYKKISKQRWNKYTYYIYICATKEYVMWEIYRYTYIMVYTRMYMSDLNSVTVKIHISKWRVEATCMIVEQSRQFKHWKLNHFKRSKTKSWLKKAIYNVTNQINWAIFNKDTGNCTKCHSTSKWSHRKIFLNSYYPTYNDFLL